MEDSDAVPVLQCARSPFGQLYPTRNYRHNNQNCCAFDGEKRHAYRKSSSWDKAAPYRASYRWWVPRYRELQNKRVRPDFQAEQSDRKCPWFSFLRHPHQCHLPLRCLASRDGTIYDNSHARAVRGNGQSPPSSRWAYEVRNGCHWDKWQVASFLSGESGHWPACATLRESLRAHDWCHHPLIANHWPNHEESTNKSQGPTGWWRQERCRYYIPFRQYLYKHWGFHQILHQYAHNMLPGCYPGNDECRWSTYAPRNGPSRADYLLPKLNPLSEQCRSWPDRQAQHCDECNKSSRYLIDLYEQPDQSGWADFVVQRRSRQYT